MAVEVAVAALAEAEVVAVEVAVAALAEAEVAAALVEEVAVAAALVEEVAVAVEAEAVEVWLLALNRLAPSCRSHTSRRSSGCHRVACPQLLDR